MRRTLPIFLLIIAEIAMGQNIVPNGGYEEIDLCPTGSGQIFRAPPWQSSWNSPDLFNECGSNGYSVPINDAGWQLPHTGSGYSLVATYSQDWHGQNVREFLKCPLEYPLVEAESYYVEYYVSQCDSLQFATHNLGVTFTDVDTGEFGELLCWPDCEIYVENTSANPLSSKTDWVKVSGTFTAHGGEQYIHLGNFRTDDDSEIEFVGGGTDPNTVWNQAAYYIDDVWLSHVDSAHYVGVGELEEELGFDVYPNPASDVVSVECSMRLEEISLFDLWGKMLIREAVAGRKESIDLSELPDGIYLLRATDEAGNTFSQKVFRQ